MPSLRGAGVRKVLVGSVYLSKFSRLQQTFSGSPLLSDSGVGGVGSRGGMEEGGDGTAGGKGKGGKGKGGKVKGGDEPKKGGAVQTAEPPGVLVERDVVFGKSEEGADLFLDLWRRGPTNAGESVGDVESGDSKKDKASAVLWIHGGGWKAGNKNHIPACVLPVLAQGIVVASVGYRKSTSMPFPACIRDCKAAVRYLRAASDQLQIDPERIGVIGSSAGGHLGLLLAFLDERLEESDAGSARCSSAVQAIVDIAGPTDLRMEENASQDASLESLLLGGNLSCINTLAHTLSLSHTHTHTHTHTHALSHTHTHHIR